MRKHLAVYSLALVPRVIGVFLTTLTGLNPEADADAVTFGRYAQRAAEALLQGELIIENVWAIQPTWGTLLAPFWLLPGPHAFYGRLGNAVLGSLAVYNVYVIARHHHSHRAGVFAALPMIVYPSFVAIHSTLLREALVLFCITTATRLAIVPGIFESRWSRSVLAVALLGVATLMRMENMWLFGVVVGVGVGVHLLAVTRRSSILAYAGAGVLGVLGAWSWGALVEKLLSFADTRRLRARGRTAYLPDVLPDSVLEIVAFSWIGAVYFLFSPFPWMVQTPADLLLSLEALGNLILAVAAVFGVRRLVRTAPAATTALLVGLVLGSVLYGLGEANVGTAMRHRQQLVWILYLFAGVGIASRIHFVTGIERLDAFLGHGSPNQPGGMAPRERASPHQGQRERRQP